MPDASDAHDAAEMLTRGIQFRAVREQLREVDFVFSTPDLDSHDTIIRQNWKLDRFTDCPTILYSHRGDDRLPIGQGRNVRVQDGVLQGTIFFSKITALAEEVFQQVLEKTLRASSVGFWPHKLSFEEIDGKEVVVLDENELIEISVVPVPSNKNALAKLKARAHSLRAEPTSPTPATPDNVTERAALTDQGTIPMSLPATDDAAALKTKVTELETLNRDLDFKSREATKLAAEHEKRAVELASKVEVLELQTKRLGEERDAAVTARDIAEGKVIASEVDALVGVKISAAERDGFAKLCKQDRALFDQMIAQRTDMKLTEQIVPSDKNDVPTPPVLDERAKKKAAAERDFAELEAAANKD